MEVLGRVLVPLHSFLLYLPPSPHPPADLTCSLSKDYNWVQRNRWAVSAQGKSRLNSPIRENGWKTARLSRTGSPFAVLAASGNAG